MKRVLFSYFYKKIQTIFQHNQHRPLHLYPFLIYPHLNNTILESSKAESKNLKQWFGSCDFSRFYTNFVQLSTRPFVIS